jgi:putative tricarboxylic transport membrane protein
MVNYIASLCFSLLAGTYLYATYLLPVLKSSDPLGPRLYPVFLGTALFTGVILLLVETIRAKRQVNNKKEKSQEGTQGLIPKTVWGVIAWTVVFLFIFEPLGYIVATAIYMLPLMVYFNPQKWWANGIISVLFPIGMYMLFSKYLGVILPRGVINW